MRNDVLKWITSAGGPLVLLDEELATYWTGAGDDDSSSLCDGETDTNGRKENASKAPTDYERACSVTDYVGLLAVGPGQCVILGEEPMPTAWWPELDSGAGIIIRWRWAQDEQSALAAVRNSLRGNWSEGGPLFRVLSGSLVLFDSACPGVDIDCTRSGCLLTIALGKGHYEIRTLFCEPDDQTAMILHRLSPLL